MTYWLYLMFHSDPTPPLGRPCSATLQGRRRRRSLKPAGFSADVQTIAGRLVSSLLAGLSIAALVGDSVVEPYLKPVFLALLIAFPIGVFAEECRIAGSAIACDNTLGLKMASNTMNAAQLLSIGCIGVSHDHR